VTGAPSGRYLGRLACPRCGRQAAEAEAFAGCPRCRGEGVPVNLAPVYDLSPTGGVPVDPAEPGLFRHRALLPVGPGEPVSLGEGRTPLLRPARLAAALGVPGLLVKDETRNPTWSYKDRLAAVAVTKAVQDGAGTLVVATTGNHGAAAAAYAAAAGLRCVVLTLASVPLTMKVLMQTYGAEVVALRTGPERWEVMAQAVAERGWVPLSGFASPPIGSNPFGVDGYKTIAYELVEALGRAPDVVVVPTAYADGLSGIWRGFTDLAALGVLDRLPRMVAAEPFGPHARALAGEAEVAGPVPVRPSVAFSTATPVGTYQGLAALRGSGGTAVAVPDDDEILDAQALAGRTAGLYVEAASATCFPAVRRLAAEGAIAPGETTVVIATASGLKDVDTTAARLADVPVIAPTLDALDGALRAVPAR
jgi:threonine synthase